MKVNMTPNPLDVVTIHASQNDGEARQWEFELHNNGELIDTSEITEQLFFKAYKGGTEQILPENGSTPATSPFKGDIKYPQGLLTDQEFLYRESPTEEDGLAKITDIKGNTIVWNQLVPNDVINVTQTTAIDWSTFTSSSFNFSLIQRHKYLFILKGQTVNGGQIGLRDSTAGIVFRPNTGYAILYTANASTYNTTYLQGSWSGGTTNAYLNMFDLTQMGLDISSPSEFTSLFSLPYYAYNQGTLLSFNGNGIKTVGKNMINTIEQGLFNLYGEDEQGTTRLRTDYIKVLPNTEYAISGNGSTFPLAFFIRFFDDNNNSYRISEIGWITSYHFTTPSNCNYLRILIRNNNNPSGNISLSDVSDVQLELGSSITEYVPYTSSTLSLPISTYFPSGMKSAGNVYDELTESKAITRIGSVDLGSLTWASYSGNAFFYAFINDGKSNYGVRVMPNILCAMYQTVNTRYSNEFSEVDKIVTWSRDSSQVQIKDTSYSTVEAFKTAMSGQHLYYELATESETSFNTASLVTENAEIPLSNEDGTLIGKCTEQLSENPGFFDAKIKLADDDGTCYSNKIQLHVERSPQ